MSLKLIAELPQIDEPAAQTLATQLWPLLRAGDMVALDGDLGAGKTSFSRALIRAAMNDQNAEVPSPTFTLFQIYEPMDGPRILHGDMYRLTDPEEAYELGLEDEQESAALLIEWPERLPADMLRGALWLRFEMNGEVRRLRIAADPAWEKRLLGAWPTNHSE